MIPGLTHELNTAVVDASLLTALGFLALYAGYSIIPSRRVLRVKPMEPRYLMPAVVVGMALSVAAFLFLIARAGGIGPLMLQRGLRNDLRIEAELGAHWRLLVRAMIPGCLVWLSHQPHVWKRPLFLLGFASALFMNFAATGSRGHTIIPIAMALVIHALHYKRFYVFHYILFGLAALVAIGFLGEFRSGTRRATDLSEVSIDTNVWGGLVRGIETVAARGSETAGLYGILRRVPREVDLLYGRSYLSIPAAPIPRRLWKAKPDAGGRLTATHIFDQPFTAIPPGSIGEAYWNFHVPGVVLVMLLYGAVLRWCAQAYLANSKAKWAVVIYTYTLFYLQPNSESFYNWVQAIAPAAILVMCIYGRLPRRCHRDASIPASVPRKRHTSVAAG